MCAGAGARSVARAANLDVIDDALGESAQDCFKFEAKANAVMDGNYNVEFDEVQSKKMSIKS